MISNFISSSLEKAKYKLLDDGTFFAEIPGLRGVWANGKSLEACRRELAEVLEGWLLLKVQNREKVPGFKLPNRLVIANA